MTIFGVLGGFAVGAFVVIFLLAVYQAGKQEGFDAGFSAAVELDDDEPPTHAELQAAAAREGRQ